MIWIILGLACISFGAYVAVSEHDFFFGFWSGLLAMVLSCTIAGLAILLIMDFGGDSFSEVVSVDEYEVGNVNVGTVSVTSMAYVNTGSNGGGGMMLPITTSSQKVTYVNLSTGVVEQAEGSDSKLYYSEDKESKVVITSRQLKGVTSFLYGKLKWESEYLFTIGKEE